MKIAARRRLAVGVLATTGAVLASFLVAPAANAGNIASVDPTFAINNDPSETLTLTTESEFAPGASIRLTRVGTSGDSADTLSATTPATSVNPNRPSATFNFLDSGSGATDGPANPGLYNVTVTNRQGVPGGPDACQSCFTVIPASALSVTGTEPTAVEAGRTQNVTVKGGGFARGTRIDVLLPGTSTVDTAVSSNGAPTRPGSEDECLDQQQTLECDIEIDDRTTPTTLLRKFVVSTGATAGPRDLRVTNTDGTTSTCSGCFTVNGAALTGVNPNVVSNSPQTATSTVSITFTGPNVPTSGTPSLAFVGTELGSASRGDLTIVGRNATFGANSVTADYEVRNAAPGSNAYQPTLTQTDGSSNICTCRFSVAQPSPAQVTSLDPSTINQSDSRTVTVRGASFSKGVKFTVSGTGVTVASVEFVSDSEARANLQTTADAAPGKRDVTASTTDGRTGPVCGGCLTVNASGATPGPTASASASSSPSAGARENARYDGLNSPLRVLDTRSNRGTARTGEIVLDLSQQITDPNATAAVLNVTVTNPTARGFLVAYPNGNTKPGTSNVNFDANQTQANEVVVGLPANRRVSLFVDSARAHVIADLVGFFTTTVSADTGRVTTNAPVRAFDSRDTTTPTRRGEVIVDLSNRIPSGSTDAVLNVTVTRTSARGFVTVFPTGTTRPETSNVNFEAAQTQANEVITRVGTGSNAGKVSLFIDSADAALIVDLVGAVTPGNNAGTQVFTALEQPTRALNTRDNSGSRRTGDVVVTMPSTVPSNATGVVLNVTATNGTRPGFVTVYPAGSTRPATSNVNFRAERAATATRPASAGTQANEVVTALGNNRQVTLFIGGAGTPAAHLIVDVVGYLTTAGAAPAPAGSPTPSASCTPGLLTTCPTPSGSPSATPSATPTGSPSATPTATASAAA